MADDLSKRAPQDASRISLREPWEIRHWTEKFGITKEVLIDAVEEVGNSAKAVAELLKERKK
jgi:hypothetical protein